MGLGEAMIVGGVGCRRGTSAAAVAQAIETALARAGVASDRLAVIATAASKETETGIVTAAATLGVPLVFVPQADLQAATPRTLTHSEKVMELFGTSSIAEAAALAAAGPSARLLGARIAVGPVTCALAEAEGAP